MLGLAIFMQSAHAFSGPSTFAAYFLVPDATHDVAFVLLDRVFGLPEFFVDVARQPTCVVSGEQCFNLNQSTRELTPDNTIYTSISVKDGTVNAETPVALNFPWPFHLALQK